jgi:hypothetical protein
MRGITRDALVRMGLQSESWEYASEMVLTSVHMGLRTAEVPVTFLKDRDGRLSHHKRSGWLSPWKAAWINLKAMFIYGSDFFVFRPGLLLAALGALLVFPVSFGDIKLGAVTLSINWQFLGLAVLVIGLQAFFLGCIARVLFDYSGRKTARLLRIFSYTRTVFSAVGLGVFGVILCVPLLIDYLHNSFSLTSKDAMADHMAVTGLSLTIVSAELFIFVLLLYGAAMATARITPGGSR